MTIYIVKPLGKKERPKEKLTKEERAVINAFLKYYKMIRKLEIMFEREYGKE